MAVLLGSLAYEIPIQGTTDFYHLSDDFNTYAIDYGTSPSGFILDTYPAYGSQLAKAEVQATEASGKNLPTTVTTFSVNPGHIAQSYLFDFYYRVHTSVKFLELGNILSEQIFSIEIWNAWFSDTDITSLYSTALQDITLDLGISIPHTFTPLAYVTGTITVAATGVPIVDGFYTLTFDTGQVIIIPVTGQRVITWPFAPQTLTSRREWLTDIIPSRHGEQRFAIREVPRETISCSYTFKDVKEYSLAKQIGQANAHVALATPLWTNATQLSGVVIGQTSIPFTTANLEFEAGGLAIFWSNYDSFEVAEVLSVSSGGIVTRLPLATARGRCWVMPLFIGYLPNGVNLNRAENKKFSGNLDFNIVRTYNLPIWPNEVTYLGLPVVTNNSVVSGGLQERFSREVDTFDSMTGDFIPYDVDDYTRGNQLLSIKAASLAELYSVRRQFDYLQGRYQAFWLPAFNTDLIAAESVLAGVTSIKVNYGGWSKYSLNHIRIISTDGTIYYFQVTAAIDNLDGTESLAITPSAPETITNIKRIEILTKMRLDTDSVEFSRSNTRVTTVKAVCKEVLS